MSDETEINWDDVVTTTKVLEGHRITIPQEIRETLGITTGDRIVWSYMPDGSVLIEKKDRTKVVE